MLDYQKDNNTLRKVKIYTDGACSQNGSWEGGWAFIIMTDSLVYKKNGYSKQTTNQKMELTAILEALESLKEPSSVDIYTDSMYCVNTINTWLENWLRENHSKRANFDLWTRFYELSKGHFIKAIHVRGHSTDDLNNECDELAVKGRNQVFIEDLKTF